MVKDLTPIEPGVLNLRISDIRTFHQCRRRFYLEGLQGLFPQPDTPAADTIADIEYEIVKDDEELVVKERPAKRRDEGTMAHAVAEAWYKGELDDLANDPSLRLLAIDEIIDHKATELTTDIDEATWVQARRYAKAAARGFPGWLEREGHDVGREVVSVEERFTAKLRFRRPNTPYQWFQITGQPDVVQLDTMTGEYEVGDTKHVASLQKGRPRDADFQLVGYSWLLGQAMGYHVSGAYQNRLARSLQTPKAAGPFYERVPIAITTAKLAHFETNLIRTLTDIARMVEHMHRGRGPESIGYSETQLCAWMCNVGLVCDSMSSGRDWRGLANEYYGADYEETFDG